MSLKLITAFVIVALVSFVVFDNAGFVVIIGACLAAGFVALMMMSLVIMMLNFYSLINKIFMAVMMPMQNLQSYMYIYRKPHFTLAVLLLMNILYIKHLRIPADEHAIGFATRSKNSNQIVSVTSYLRKTIVTIAFVNGFIQGGHVELFRFVLVKLRTSFYD